MEEIRRYLAQLREEEGPAVAALAGVVFVAGLFLSLLFNVDWPVLWAALQAALGQ